MYPIQQYAWNELPSGLAYQIASFIRLIWLNELKGEDRFWDFFNSPEVAAHFVISERDILISHALIRRREIEHQGSTYKLLGVGAVMTYPAFRGEGYASRVVEAVTNYILSSDADVGMLFTDTELEPFYARWGWVSINHPGITSGDPDHPELEADAFTMMLFVSDKAQAHHADFERGPIFVGEFTW